MPSKSKTLATFVYRGCWHEVSRAFLSLFFQARGPRAFKRVTGVYNPRAFILHAASLGQACAHCRRFSTAASRRSPGSVSVPMRPVALSGRLPVVALVSRYLTN